MEINAFINEKSCMNSPKEQKESSRRSYSTKAIYLSHKHNKLKEI